MRILMVWEQGDALSCNVCLFLSPPEWGELRAVHSRLGRRLHASELRRLFAQRLQERVASAAGLSSLPLEEDPQLASLTRLLSLSSAVDCMSEVLTDVVTYPQLAEPSLAPLRQALTRLHRLALRDQQLMPRERSGRRPSLPRRLLRSFAGFSGLLPRLVTLLASFPAEGDEPPPTWREEPIARRALAMPPPVFVLVCEVIASLVHNTKEAKRAFLTTGGLASVLSFLRVHSGNVTMQAAGLAVLLALSARSVMSIRLMVEAGTHEVVASALQQFQGDAKIVARATGLLANMSNVPCVLPALQRCGVLALAKSLLSQGDPPADGAALSPIAEGAASYQASSPELAPASPFVRDFVQYLVSNLQEHHGAV